MTEQNKSHPNYWKTLEVIGGISGVSIGLSIILASSGFLSLKANSNLLGLSNLLQHSINDYLLEGSILFIYLFSLAKELMFNYYTLVFIGGIVILFLIIQNVLKYYSKESILKFDVFPDNWILAGFMIAVLCSISLLLPSLYEVDLLFDEASNHQGLSMRASKKGHYELLLSFNAGVSLIAFSMLAGILILKRRIIQKLKKTAIKWVFYPIFFLFIFQFLLLPISYGKWVKPNNFHKVSDISFSSESLPINLNTDELFLINFRESDVILFQRSEKNQIIIIPNAGIKQLTLDEPTNIFY